MSTSTRQETRPIRLLGPVDYSLIQLSAQLATAGELIYSYSGAANTNPLPPTPIAVKRGFIVIQVALAANGTLTLALNGITFTLNGGISLTGGALYEFWVSVNDGDTIQVQSAAGITWLRLFQR